ncbi:MAG TPA: SCP2 sterol-binding domain-containing protein [Gammaproteobacteria bacterium]|nr:SCP2 sterol-binding domain-containing protein [Gammaproteobacteria bacterium]
MTDNACREVFENLKEGQFNPLLEGVNGSYRFDIKGAGSWHVAVEDGRIYARESDESAECRIECEAEDFLLIIQGQRNLITAAMQGRVSVSGDLALAQKFHGLVGAGAGQRAQPRSKPS